MSDSPETDYLLKDINKGQQFGHLIVLSTVKKGSHTYLVCRCDCGETEELKPDPIRKGKRVRCSKCHNAWLHNRDHLKIDRTGERHGKLLLVERLNPTKPSRCARYRCKCDCGNEVIMRDTSIIVGTKSCGCTRHGIQMKKGFKLPVDAAWTNIYNTYKRNAFNRDLPFELTKDRLKELCSSDCSYCGCKPATKYWQKAKKLSKERIRMSTMMVNGIDRVDSSKGYTEGNVVPCCKQCNYAKLDRTIEEFKAWIIQVYNNLKLGQR